MSLEAIINDCDIRINRCVTVSGGDISGAYCLLGNDCKYFLKVNDANLHQGLFLKECNGLNSLRENSILNVPMVLKTGIISNQQYLLMEWIEKGKSANDFWQTFGSALANMHRRVQPYFGWHENNYIGNLLQENAISEDWPGFYTQYRIMPLVEQLFNAGSFSGKDLRLAELFCKSIEGIFPKEPPASLHGDFWSGNFMVAATGYPVIYDPAVYNGHREMDIGMALLFGGFDQEFFQAYHETYPLEKGWEDRVRFSQLYPILVHAVLFKGHYVEMAQKILKL